MSGIGLCDILVFLAFCCIGRNYGRSQGLDLLTESSGNITHHYIAESQDETKTLQHPIEKITMKSNSSRNIRDVAGDEDNSEVITVNGKGEGGEVDEKEEEISGGGGGGPRFAMAEERAKAQDGKQAMSEERAKAHDVKQAMSEERAKAHNGKQAMSEERAKAHDGKQAVQGYRWGPSCGGFWCWVGYIIKWILVVISGIVCFGIVAYCCLGVFFMCRSVFF